MGRSLVLRRGRDGGVRVEGGSLPDSHTLSARFVQREIESGLVSVQVTLNVEGGPVVYEMTGFEPFEDAVDGDGNAKLNFTAWQMRLVEQSKPKRSKGGDDRG